MQDVPRNDEGNAIGARCGVGYGQGSVVIEAALVLLATVHGVQGRGLLGLLWLGARMDAYMPAIKLVGNSMG